jgi:metal-responsive CopG/Arc/MetJ family transcriptional regulator
MSLKRPQAKKGTYHEKKKINISVSAGLLNKVDKIAIKNELSRSNVIENFIEISLLDYKILDSLGLISIARMMRDFIEKGFTIESKQKKIII